MIGVSTGGPRTLEDILPHLPGDLPAGVVVVQHMPPRFTASLAQRLDQYSKLHICEAQEGMKLSNGLAVIAPGVTILCSGGRAAALHAASLLSRKTLSSGLQ